MPVQHKYSIQFAHIRPTMHRIRLVYYTMCSYNYCTYRLLYYTYTILIVPFESQDLFTCVPATQILAVASIREWQLFRSGCLEVRRQFESSD